MAFQFNQPNTIGPPTTFLATLMTDNFPDVSILNGLNDKPLDMNRPKNGTARVDEKDDSGDPSTEKRDRRNNKPRDRDFKSRDEDSNLSNSSDVITLQTNTTSAPPPPSMAPNMWAGMMSMSYPMVGMNMIMDPNVMSMNNFGMMPPMMAAAATASDNLITPPNNADPNLMINPPVKEIIHCKSCTMFPPNPNAPPPTTRERPPGCRTVFVGGLPENMTEEIIMEVFERCGEVTTLRLSKKNFCHIRFVYEASVDAAIFLSGYRIRIGSNTDPPNTGRLHVDYAQARDDQYEWECRQRQLQREQRHRERMEEERLRPPSPPPVVHYTDHEASAVSEKIKQDDTFTKAVQIVITWLERGDCSKRNANNFYSMIQSTNSHVRRLMNEKVQYEEELQKAKEIMKGRMQGILLQFSQIERLFMAACHKKVWDHFTKAQRKNIELWKKQSMEIKNVQIDGDSFVERGDDEMDLSDEENPMPRKKTRMDVVGDENNQLKDENTNLRCQMEAYKNEVDVIKMDLRKELDDKEKQFKMLQQTLHGMQQQLLEAKKKQTEEENRVKELQLKLKQTLEKNTTTINLDDLESDKTDSLSSEGRNNSPLQEQEVFTDKDARLVGIISAFLNVHPFGAGLDYIWSYVSKLEVNVRPSDLELLMSRFPSVFSQEVIGIGANIERRWLFSAFKTPL
ncbi:PREDICTED: ecto-NOX disulfide-thiol exchanger 2 [Nicrophorus vespilloides]|uniref:Ecto-NOX disulfide-thiol exchanger 2 n=1 Tax=Nicrophorus vespilloides TaxID=110193 RepID=A0ABM1MCR9_NICVS|nr:PREDICTED: ecto-NOX disulfide-thiol exchanger 2 [Nicrophorus vespilloides]